MPADSKFPNMPDISITYKGITNFKKVDMQFIAHDAFVSGIFFIWYAQNQKIEKSNNLKNHFFLNYFKIHYRCQSFATRSRETCNMGREMGNVFHPYKGNTLSVT